MKFDREASAAGVFGGAEIAFRVVPAIRALQRDAPRVINRDQTAIAILHAGNGFVVGGGRLSVMLRTALEIAERRPHVRVLIFGITLHQSLQFRDARFGLVQAAVINRGLHLRHRVIRR